MKSRMRLRKPYLIVAFPLNISITSEQCATCEELYVFRTFSSFFLTLKWRLDALYMNTISPLMVVTEREDL